MISFLNNCQTAAPRRMGSAARERVALEIAAAPSIASRLMNFRQPITAPKIQIHGIAYCANEAAVCCGSLTPKNSNNVALKIKAKTMAPVEKTVPNSGLRETRVSHGARHSAVTAGSMKNPAKRRQDIGGIL